MILSNVNTGKNAPDEVNVIIEIPAGLGGVKYEFDKEIGSICVDRFMSTAMFYPANYGFIPNTLADDGDPVDVLVITRTPLMPGCLISARPIGFINMEDESGMDEKIIALPTPKADPYYKDINEISQLPDIQLKQIIHFFERYKDLDSNKWVKIKGHGSSLEAKNIINKFMK